MKIPVNETKSYDFPDKITNRQFLAADLQMIMKISEQTINFEDLGEVQKMIRWMIEFIAVLGTDLMDEPFEDLVAAMKHENFGLWLNSLFGHFQ